MEFHTRARLIRYLGVQHAGTDFLDEALGHMTDKEFAEEEAASNVMRTECQKEGVDVLQSYLPAVADAASVLARSPFSVGTLALTLIVTRGARS